MIIFAQRILIQIGEIAVISLINIVLSIMYLVNGQYYQLLPNKISIVNEKITVWFLILGNR